MGRTFYSGLWAGQAANRSGRSLEHCKGYRCCLLLAQAYFGDVGAGLGVGGGSPTERNDMNLFNTSNQNGAPNDTASVVASNPTIFTIQLEKLPGRVDQPSAGWISWKFSCIPLRSIVSGFWAAPWAAATIEARITVLPIRLLTSESVSTFKYTTITRAKIKRINCTFRAYQPETRSIASLNHFSTLAISFSRSPLTGLIRVASVFCSSGLEAGVKFCETFLKARAKSREGIYEALLCLFSSLSNVPCLSSLL